MGFFNKMKAMKNAVTGGAAKVYIESEDISYTDSFKITVQAKIGDANIKANSVYVTIQGNEEVEVPDVDVIYDDEGDRHRKREIVYASHRTLNLKFEIAEEQELEANQTYRWEVDIELPEDAPSIFKGRFSEHTYKAIAGIDCFGNDPDSGWIELED